MIIDTDKLMDVPDKKLVELKGLIEEEKLRRRKNKPVVWECGECGLQDKDGDVIYAHLRKVHRYPEEDAHLSTIPVYMV